MRDPYEVLGVDRKANEAEIKSAFRRQAKKLHPDANKNDPKAASRFAELNAAYEILGEEDKRKAFDRGEIDAEGKPRFHGFEGFGGGGGRGVLITVSVAQHPIFTLEGADVRLDLPITLDEATLGAKVRVPTLDRPVEITIPPWTSSGRTFRLKGKGFPAKEGHGDLLATVRIVLPDRSDSELEALMKKWQSGKPYDARKNM